MSSENMDFNSQIKLGLMPDFIEKWFLYNWTNLKSRNADNICEIFARTENFKICFYPKSIREYNQLPLYIRQSMSIVQIKRLIKVKIVHPKPKCWYSLGDRKMLIAPARLKRIYVTGDLRILM